LRKNISLKLEIDDKIHKINGFKFRLKILGNLLYPEFSPRLTFLDQTEVIATI
jgi:hypothetical protein